MRGSVNLHSESFFNLTECVKRFVPNFQDFRRLCYITFIRFGTAVERHSFMHNFLYPTKKHPYVHARNGKDV